LNKGLLFEDVWQFQQLKFSCLMIKGSSDVEFQGCTENMFENQAHTLGTLIRRSMTRVSPVLMPCVQL
jgi:hypothetical protein